MSRLSFTTTTGQTPDDGPLELTEFDIDDEPYAAVRPVDEAFVELMAAAQLPPAQIAVQVAAFLDLVMKPEEIAEALEELGRDPYETSEAMLVMSQGRLRQRLLNRRDKFNLESLADVMKGLVEGWAGKAPGRPQDYLPPRSSTGKSSTRRSTAKASTSSRSSAGGRRAR